MFDFFTRTVGRDTVLTESERQTSTYIVGQPGVGKSRLIESLIRQDILAGRGVGVIDVAGDLHNRMLAWLATQRERWDKIILIEPTQREYVIRLNPLAPLPGVPAERVAVNLTDLGVSLFKLDPTQTPRLVDVMSYAFLAMSATGLTLTDLKDFLLVKPFRDQQLRRLPSDLLWVQDYFEYEYPKSLGGARLWSVPVLNKWNRVLFDPDIRLMMGGGKALDFREIIDGGYIVLAHIPKGILGKGTASLAAAFLVARYQQAAMGRVDTTPDTPEARPPYYLYLDEFQNYTTDNISEILDESRKYALRLTMAHQYLEQLSLEVRSSVLSSSGTVACMRVGYNDAKELAPYVFPGQAFMTQTETRYRVTGTPQARTIGADDRREDFGWDGLAEVLANQPVREFWMRRKGDTEPIRLHTEDTPDMRFTPEVRALIHQLRRRSGERFGAERAVVKAELLAQEQVRRAMRAAEKATLKQSHQAEPKRGRGRPKKQKPLSISSQST